MATTGAACDFGNSTRPSALACAKIEIGAKMRAALNQKNPRESIIGYVNTEEDNMALEMKNECEKCGRALTADDEAYICTHECTFCRSCTEKVNSVCPNCGGELVRRPRSKSESP